MTTITIRFDSTDWKGMRDLMNHHEDYPEMLFGKTSDGEDMNISINSDNIVTTVYQNNGWIRKKIYHSDYDVEESYEGRYK